MRSSSTPPIRGSAVYSSVARKEPQNLQPSGDIPARPHPRSCERTIARDLQEFCADPRFRRSIEVTGDFAYVDCWWSLTEDGSADPLPEFVYVVLQTALSPGKPAVSGALSYKCRDFRSEIEKMVERDHTEFSREGGGQARPYPSGPAPQKR